MKRILSVKLHREMDDNPDVSYLGEYSSLPGPEDTTIDRHERGDQQSREYRYFIAAMSGEDTGNPDSVEHDYQRMEDYNRGEWCMVGVYATADVVLTGYVVQHIRSGGLWGIESDSDGEHFADVEKEEFATLRGELEAVGFTKQQINAAFRSNSHVAV